MMFHKTLEGHPFRKGVNWLKVPGWARLVFFCGDCKLYLRLRWKPTLRVFCHWELRPEKPQTCWFTMEHGQFVPEKDIAECEALRAAQEAGK
jgi:hypothetical protein